MKEMERVAQETMDKAVTYQNELENQKLSGQKQVRSRPLEKLHYVPAAHAIFFYCSLVGLV